MKIEVNENTKIYVLALAHYKTGGLELLHQLVKQLNDLEYDASIVYYNLKKEENIHPEFRQYVNEYRKIKDIVDNEDNILIVPETRIQLLAKFKRIRKVIWWLSVDNYFPTTSIKVHVEKFGGLRTIKHCFVYHDKLKEWDLKQVADYHLVQSEYARLFLVDKGINDVGRLSDYLNDTYLNKTYDIRMKKNDVLYNPAKGFEFTKRLIEKGNNINWVALRGMTTKEVSQALLQGKIYVDFGNHPGKDRFPREAALSGCCILTGRRGAAKNSVDIPIMDKYKFDENSANEDEIIEKIMEIFNNYEQSVDDFEEYRNKIRNEKRQFLEDIKCTFVKS